MKSNKDKWTILTKKDSKNSIKFNLNITFSKLMAFLILLCATAFSFKAKDHSVMILGMTISAGIIGYRQHNQKQIKKILKENEEIL